MEPSSNETNPLTPFLQRQGVVLLDGGLASELEVRGHRLQDSLWSARLLMDDPDAILDVHLDYLRAGADVVVSASYQASLQGFAQRGLGPAAGEALLRRSVRLARQAVEAFESSGADGRLRPLVAASIGPYGAFLADGSEYRGDDSLDEDALMDFHRRRLDILAETIPESGGADLLACETIPSGREARALTALLAERRSRGRGVPAWLSLSCRDGARLADGTPIADLVQQISHEPSWVALGVNCTAPRHVPSLITAVASQTDLPVLAYPNSGETWDAEAKRWGEARGPEDGQGVGLADLAPSWRRLGARLLGGCCRTTPSDIRRLRRVLVGGPDAI